MSPSVIFRWVRLVRPGFVYALLSSCLRSFLAFFLRSESRALFIREEPKPTGKCAPLTKLVQHLQETVANNDPGEGFKGKDYIEELYVFQSFPVFTLFQFLLPSSSRSPPTSPRLIRIPKICHTDHSSL